MAKELQITALTEGTNIFSSVRVSAVTCGKQHGLILELLLLISRLELQLMLVSCEEAEALCKVCNMQEAEMVFQSAAALLHLK